MDMKRSAGSWLRKLGFGGVAAGMVLAVTSVGAGDMVTTLNSSSEYGMALAWTIVLGIIIKFALTEAVVFYGLIGGLLAFVLV